MDKKYIFFDIDGTLTCKETNQIVDSAKYAIEQLQKQGHFVAIATGRAHYKTIDLAKSLGIHHFVSNGGAAITIDDQLIENKPLDRNKAILLCEEAQAKGCGVLFSTDNSIDVTMLDYHFLNQVGYRKEPTRYFYEPQKNYCDFDSFYKLYIAVSKDDERKLSLLDSLSHIRFVQDYLIYQHDQKDEGIMRMLELVGGRKEDVVVFGDDVNDLVMFKDDWFSIAMGNACDELKKCACFVTKDNVDDGILYACKHFGWILDD